MNMVDYNIKAFMKNRSKTLMNYLTLKQKLDVMADCNEIALVLLEFYCSKSGYSAYSYSDLAVCQALRWKKSKVQKNRLLLTKHNYFKQIVTSNNKNTHVETVLGQKWEDERIVAKLMT